MKFEFFINKTTKLVEHNRVSDITSSDLLCEMGREINLFYYLFYGIFYLAKDNQKKKTENNIELYSRNNNSLFLHYKLNAIVSTTARTFTIIISDFLQVYLFSSLSSVWFLCSFNNFGISTVYNISCYANLIFIRMMFHTVSSFSIYKMLSVDDM